MEQFLEKIPSIFLFYAVFFIAFCFFLFADRAKNEVSAKLYTILGVMVLCWFAGARDLSVGIDTARTVYARFSIVSSAFDLNRISGIHEPIYRLISFFLKQITDEPWIFLFSMQLLTAGPIAAALYKYRKKAFISIGMLVYMLMFYQYSMNIMRQSVSVSFLLWAAIEYFDNNYFKSVFLSILSCFFHSSGIIGIVLISGTLLLAKIDNPKVRIAAIVFLSLIGTFAVFNWKSAFLWTIENDLVTDKYSSYVSNFSGEGRGRYTNTWGIGIFWEIMRFLSVMLSIYLLDMKIKKYDYEALFLKYAGMVSLLLYSVILFMLSTNYGYRLTLALDFLQIILFSRIYTMLSKGAITYNNGIIYIKNADSLGIVFYILIYSLAFVSRYSNGTLPYLFS